MITVEPLIANAGYMFTQADDIPDMERSFSEQLYLGVGDSIDNWKQIPKEEAIIIMQKQQELLD